MDRARSLIQSVVSICGFAAGIVALGAVRAPEPPKLDTWVKSAVKKRVMEDRAVMTHASLIEGESHSPTGFHDGEYSFYATMQVAASAQKTREILTDYSLYPKMIPYVQKADYNASSRTLTLVGGIWKFQLSSTVKFEEVGPRWIRYEIIAGHFQGLRGDIVFESLGEKGTWVYLRGSQKGTRWPPKLIIERGAEIVFEFTAKRMRSYIEESQASSKKASPKGDGHISGEKNHDTEVPRPRSHL